MRDNLDMNNERQRKNKVKKIRKKRRFGIALHDYAYGFDQKNFFFFQKLVYILVV